MGSMKRTKIIVDSTADLTPADLSMSGVEVVPTRLTLGGKTFASTAMTPQQLLDLIDQHRSLPVSGPPPVEAYTQAFTRALAEHDEVISLHISSKLSQSYAMGQAAAADFGSRVHVVESPSGTYALGLQALRAARMADQGLGAAPIISALGTVQGQQFVRFTLDTLRFLQMTGRVNNISALLSRLFGVKPIFCYRDGLLELAGRERGFDRAIESMATDLTQFISTLPGGVRVTFLHSPGGEATAGRLRQVLGDWGLSYQDMGLRPIGNTSLWVTGPRAAGLVAEPL